MFCVAGPGQCSVLLVRALSTCEGDGDDGIAGRAHSALGVPLLCQEEPCIRAGSNPICRNHARRAGRALQNPPLGASRIKDQRSE